MNPLGCTNSTADLTVCCSKLIVWQCVRPFRTPPKALSTNRQRGSITDRLTKLRRHAVELLQAAPISLPANSVSFSARSSLGCARVKPQGSESSARTGFAARWGQLEGEARPQPRFLLVGVAEGAVRAIDVGKAAHDLALFQKTRLRILQAPRRTKILNDPQRPPNDGVCAV